MRWPQSGGEWKECIRAQYTSHRFATRRAMPPFSAIGRAQSERTGTTSRCERIPSLRSGPKWRQFGPSMRRSSATHPTNNTPAVVGLGNPREGQERTRRVNRASTHARQPRQLEPMGGPPSGEVAGGLRGVGQTKCQPDSKQYPKLTAADGH